jgi:hypothetical protein
MLLEEVERERIDALLVHDDEVLPLRAHLLLQVEDELDAVVDPLALGGQHLLALRSVEGGGGAAGRGGGAMWEMRARAERYVSGTGSEARAMEVGCGDGLYELPEGLRAEGYG